MSLSNPGRQIWDLEDADSVAESPPVLNTYATHLEESGGVILHYFAVDIDDDAHAAKNVDVKVTINGVAYETTGTNMAPGNNYFIGFDDISSPTSGAALKVSEIGPIPLFGINQETDAGSKLPNSTLPVQSIKIELKMTTALGVNQRMSSWFRISKLKVL